MGTQLLVDAVVTIDWTNDKSHEYDIRQTSVYFRLDVRMLRTLALAARR